MPHTHTHTHTQGPPLGKAERKGAGTADERTGCPRCPRHWPPGTQENAGRQPRPRGRLVDERQDERWQGRGGALTAGGRDGTATLGGGRRVASGSTPRTCPGQTGCQRLAREVHGRTTRSSPSLETARRPPAEGQTDRTWLSPRWGSTEHEKKCSPVGPARGPSGPWGVRGARRRSLGAVGAQLRDAEEGPVRRTEGGRPAGRSCTAPTRERAPEHFR